MSLCYFYIDYFQVMEYTLDIKMKEVNTYV